MPMRVELIPYGGWERNLLLANEQVELIVTLEVGPRIIALRKPGGRNLFKEYTAQLGQSGEEQWCIRGGHRLWVAPETAPTFIPDNRPVAHTILPDGAQIQNTPDGQWGIEKAISIRLDGGRVIVDHQITNAGQAPLTLAPWSLSVMAPGALEIIPQPPLGRHPEDLLPRHVIIPWPYSDMTDPRLRLGQRFITLRHAPDRGPFKFGLSHREGWVACYLGGHLFLKIFSYDEGATYPDLGANFETYTDPDMLEIETLGPLRTLQPGEAMHHRETWHLHGEIPTPPPVDDETALSHWLSPYLPSPP